MEKQVKDVSRCFIEMAPEHRKRWLPSLLTKEMQANSYELQITVIKIVW